MIRATTEVDSRGERGELQGFEATKMFDLQVLSGSYKSWIENQVRLRAQLLKVQALIYI